MFSIRYVFHIQSRWPRSDRRTKTSQFSLKGDYNKVGFSITKCTALVFIQMFLVERAIGDP